MYRIIENPKRMTREEIKKEFTGKWVYVVDLEGPEFGWFNTGVVAVVADRVLEGRETGIYRELSDKYDGRVADMSLFDKEIVPHFYEVTDDEI